MAHTLKGRYQFEPEPTRGSRFLATVAAVASEDEARSLHAELARMMPDASHHCWAWRIAQPAIDRAGDDGEPGGSAGRPILAQLTGRDLVDVAAVVSRWFGGTKLGVGGLVRAYGGAVGQALDRAEIVPWIEQIAVTINHEHGDGALVERALQQARSVEVDVGWGAAVTRHVLVPADAVDELWLRLADGTSGRIRRPDS